MSWIAWKMLTGDRSKYLGIIFGVAFATLLMAHQVSIFAGIMRRTTSQIRDIHEAKIWVMHPESKYVEENRAAV
jgi:putative ABC transport system permease protein